MIDTTVEYETETEPNHEYTSEFKSKFEYANVSESNDENTNGTYEYYDISDLYGNEEQSYFQDIILNGYLF